MHMIPQRSMGIIVSKKHFSQQEKLILEKNFFSTNKTISVKWANFQCIAWVSMCQKMHISQREKYQGIVREMQMIPQWCLHLIVSKTRFSQREKLILHKNHLPLPRHFQRNADDSTMVPAPHCVKNAFLSARKADFDQKSSSNTKTISFKWAEFHSIPASYLVKNVCLSARTADFDQISSSSNKTISINWVDFHSIPASLCLIKCVFLTDTYIQSNQSDFVATAEIIAK